MIDPVVRFIEKANSHPEHPAVVEGGVITSYRSLKDKAENIASFLCDCFSHPKVAICLSQGSDAYAAMFGTLMAGGYYCPINTDAPVLRQKEILEQFDPDVIISSSDYMNEGYLKNIDATYFDIEDDSHRTLSDYSAAHKLAYVIFTSGSTGKPKGVMISRSGLSNYVEWAIKDMNICLNDRWSQHPNIAFDLSVLDIYGALCGGATLFPLIDVRFHVIISQKRAILYSEPARY